MDGELVICCLMMLHGLRDVSIVGYSYQWEHGKEAE